MTVTVDIFKKLKKAGLLPANYRHLEKLTPAQKGWVTKVYSSAKFAISNPARVIIRRVTSKVSIAKLKEQGFDVINSRAIIRADFDANVRIIKGAVHVEGAFENKTVFNITLQELAKNGVPAWLNKINEEMKSGESWCLSYKGTPIGDFFEDIEELVYQFTDYYEKTISPSINIKQVYLMKVKTKRFTDNSSRRSRKEIMGDINKKMRAENKFKH